MTSQLNNSDAPPARLRHRAAVLGLCVGGAVLSFISVRLAEPGDPPLPASASTSSVGHAAIHLPGGSLRLAPNDWEALGKITAIEVTVTDFRIDRYEVSAAEWARCATCPAPLVAADPQLPRTNVSPQDAQHYCRERGGRLPTSAEWTYAASGAQGNRYPWGQTGLVCRKAVFGMVSGPCDQGALAPLPSGSRQLGATPTGLHDLCGNVAEWVVDGATFAAAGGSFRSTLAGQLKVWAREQTSAPRDDIGFRCVYAAETLP